MPALQPRRHRERMAGEAERLRGGGDEFHPGHVFVHPDLVATRTAHLDGGMDVLALRLIVVAFDALCAVRIFQGS